jgi:hypothetical protein
LCGIAEYLLTGVNINKIWLKIGIFLKTIDLIDEGVYNIGIIIEIVCFYDL